ncbi:uncharacterized protein LOC18425354 isoform X2 [Amborella trichopoda]|uniref:uncharacterized protein LOC18425354 isoform X2 n=1 Tax=Amborella trichopoda TaxID=13333 RepID=UPI0005D2DC79|nr:uncharacterized protein LOC18425354 isoform X2 [Amborella trichopoda]|eukprot:XP_011629317.1 uncharacterized protein LOC18425354 isoform X2 [Amborella trichopoda]
MEEASDMESAISTAMLSRLEELKQQGDSLTLEGVRRLLEKELGLETYTLDPHKRFIKQLLTKYYYNPGVENVTTNSEKKSKGDIHARTEGARKDGGKTRLEKEEQTPSHEDEKRVVEPANSKESIPNEPEIEEGSGEIEGKGLLNEDTVKKALWKRASFFRKHAEGISLSEVRRMLEKDLKLNMRDLDTYKGFINAQIEEILGSPNATDTEGSNTKETSGEVFSGKHIDRRKKHKTGACSKDSSEPDEVLDGSQESEEDLPRSKKQSRETGNRIKTKVQKKRKRSSDEGKLSIKKPAKSATLEDRETYHESEKLSDDDGPQSSLEESAKKKSGSSTPVYGKQVEHLKKIIKSCGMSVPPTVYRRVKQAPENKRELNLIKELKAILTKEGLSSNPSEKEIKEVRKRKERAKDLEGIDLTNIISDSCSRRARANFFISPPNPKPSVDSDKGIDDEDSDDDSSDSEEASDGIQEGVSEESD